VKRRDVLALALGALGLARMAGDATGIDALRGLAAATAASPAPRVFSAVRGLETYSSRFRIEWRGSDGVEHAMAITPERYAGLRGPYNRRNAYGAVVAYGPILASDPATQPLFESVARFSLCGEAPLLRELGLDVGSIEGPVRIRIEPAASSTPGDLPLGFEAPCPAEEDRHAPAPPTAGETS
jgi:hypothetical protein